MEKNLLASFSDMVQLEQAVGALRSQGALDIRVQTGSKEEAQLTSGSGRPAFYVNVYVERSRYRQAEDTILRYGGSFLS